MKTLIRSPFNRTMGFPSIFDEFFDMGTDTMTLPKVNVIENKDNFTIDVEAPGFNKGDFNINIEENRLTISSETQKESKDDFGNYHRREFRRSSFSRSFQLDEIHDVDNINATYESGILRVEIPKIEKKKKSTKVIEIQ